MHPVFFWSKKTTPQEAKQHSYVLEVKAAFLALKKFRPFLLGTEFKLVTDCSAFKQTTSKKDVPREVAQWILYLQDYNYKIEHRAGERMKHVDSLSRFPCEVYTVETELTVRFKQAQLRDSHIRAISEILKTGPYEDYKVKGGLIYRVVDGNDLLVVPKLMEWDIIRNAHDAGHFATLIKTMHSIKQNYFIPHLEN